MRSLLADGKSVTVKTLFQIEAVELFRQVSYMDRFKCSYQDYLNTPIEFISDAITIVGLINDKQTPPDKRKKL